MVEAMACKKTPVILADAIVPDELRKRCVSVDNMTEIFNNLSLLSNSMNYVDVEDNYLFAKEHTWDRCIEQYEKLYEEIVSD
jgi:glycosyltransferase involved in cell wall biosynthesis